ncbi:hypothetical protein ACR73I_06000 [Bifidobacterium pseudocatenulatum]|uniref:hypothetical protein n=1 Tax=Bifidobacterium pseudocatenulatum TaxID=28026 RepID=UPI003DA610F7
MGRQRELLRLSIILCMGLLFVMAGILLIVGKLAGKRPSSIAGGVLMIAWGLLYLSSGNLKRRRTPPPTGRGCQAFHAQWHGPSSDASHVDSSKKDTVGKESKKHES